ncbi:MAG: type II secretion system protein [Pirellulaceae bacterium]
MPNKKSAFTIVELLVVIAIIGILVALLLPAIGAVRDRARATENQNNLRSIGQALQSYYSTKQYYTPLIKYYGPPRILPTIPASALGSTTSWAFELLPYLDQQGVYDSLDFRQASWIVGSNATAFGTPIATFANPRFRDGSQLCPFNDTGEHDGAFPEFGGASIDYAANGV